MIGVEVDSGDSEFETAVTAQVDRERFHQQLLHQRLGARPGAAAQSRSAVAAPSPVHRRSSVAAPVVAVVEDGSAVQGWAVDDKPDEDDGAHPTRRQRRPRHTRVRWLV